MLIVCCYLPEESKLKFEVGFFVHLLQVRGLVNQKLEEARNGKLIGASLDAKVYLHASSAALQHDLVSMCGSNDVDHLKRIVLTSQVRILNLLLKEYVGASPDVLCELG